VAAGAGRPGELRGAELVAGLQLAQSLDGRCLGSGPADPEAFDDSCGASRAHGTCCSKRHAAVADSSLAAPTPRRRWTFTASGTATNLAARLGDHARGGQILIAAETAARVRERFALQSRSRVSLKHLSSNVEVWELLGARRVPHQPHLAIDHEMHEPEAISAAKHDRSSG